MILKVVPTTNHEPVMASYFDVGTADVHTGIYFFHEPPGRADYREIAEAKSTHVLGTLEALPSDPDGQWPCRFAYWVDDARGLQLIVTTGDIYLMSERGDTVDRVR